MRTDGLASNQAAPLVPLNIAILLNSWRSRFIEAIRDSYIRTIGAVSPDSKLHFFYPVEKDDFPDPDEFDLIIIGGSNVDPRQNWPWMLRMHAFILRLVKDYPRKKICGICWGHQTIARLFGGDIVDMETPEVRLCHHTCLNPFICHSRIAVRSNRDRLDYCGNQVLPNYYTQAS